MTDSSANQTDRSSPRLEIRLPISANEQFLRMLRYFLASLRTYGGEIASNARCVVSISRDVPFYDVPRAQPWLNEYPVEIRWMEEELFRQQEYDGTGVDRFWVESSADVVAMMDVDMLIANDLDELVLRTYREQKTLGFVAHVSPFETPTLCHKSSANWWHDIFQSAELGPPPLSIQHTGWGLMSLDPQHRYCPPYFNYGLIIAPRSHMDKIGATFLDHLSSVERVIDTWAKSQIAHTLGVFRHELPWGTLSINDNFPLHVPAGEFRKLNPDPTGRNRPEDVRVFHYCGDGPVSKQSFVTKTHLSRMLEIPADSETEVFFEKLRFLRERLQDS